LSGNDSKGLFVYQIQPQKIIGLFGKSRLGLQSLTSLFDILQCRTPDIADFQSEKRPCFPKESTDPAEPEARLSNKTVHSKVFVNLICERFVSLSDSVFWTAPEIFSVTRPVHHGLVLLFEFNSVGRYHKVFRAPSSGTRDVGEISTFTSHLINYFFEEKCKNASR
jgi:hypothetical protein